MMKKLLILSLLLASSSLLSGQTVVTLMLPDPCFSDTTVTFRPVVLQDMSVYPNPTRGLLIIDTEQMGVTHPTIIEVYNILGNRLKSVHLDSHENITLDLSDNPSGIYFISLTSGSTRVYKKIIKL